MGKSKNGETVKQHYVPRFYMKNFYNSRNKLDCWNIEHNYRCERVVKSICYEDDLYECDGGIIQLNEIEDILGKIETEIKDSVVNILKSLKKYESDAEIETCYRIPMGDLEEDIEKLVIFIVIQMIRTPNMVSEYSKIIDGFVKLNEISEEGFYQNEEVKKASREDIDKVLKSKCLELFFKDKRILAFMYARIMETHNIVFMTSERLHFLSGDEPVIISYYGKYGEMLLENSDFFFALSPNCCMSLVRKETWIQEDIPNGEYGIIKTNYSRYKYITKLLIRYSHKYVFSDELNESALKIIKETQGIVD